MVVSVEKAVTSEPSNGSAKVFSVESEEVTTSDRVYLWKESCPTANSRFLDFELL